MCPVSLLGGQRVVDVIRAGLKCDRLFRFQRTPSGEKTLIPVHPAPVIDIEELDFLAGSADEWGCRSRVINIVVVPVRRGPISKRLGKPRSLVGQVSPLVVQPGTSYIDQFCQLANSSVVLIHPHCRPRRIVSCPVRLNSSWLGTLAQTPLKAPAWFPVSWHRIVLNSRLGIQPGTNCFISQETA